MNPDPQLTDMAVHERIEAAVRERHAAEPGFVWEVKAEYCREGLLVSGRASKTALGLYYSLAPSDRWFIVHVVEVP